MTTESRPKSTPLPAWPLPAYTVSGSGAEKLSESRVAPLVAAARGYESIYEADFKTFCTAKGINGRSVAATILRTALSGGEADVLWIPWFAAKDVRRARSMGFALVRSTWQARPRPDRQRANKDTGRPIKYESPAGAPTVLGVHPSTPASWFDDCAEVWVTEGAIKADAALSAYLLASGMSHEDLASADAGALRAYMESVPPDRRVLIMSVAGAGNWHNKDDWNYFTIKGRRYVVALDGDVATNRQVWLQAKGMFNFISRGGGVPVLVDLASAAEEGGPRLGVDDYLAQVGDWDALRSLTSPDLPGEPHPPLGARRLPVSVSDERCTTEAYVIDKDGVGDLQIIAGLAGRVKTVIESRQASESDVRSGEIDGSPDSDGLIGTRVDVEVTWRDADGEKHSAIVRGPVSILSEPPEHWNREKAEIPPDLQMHPEWPPTDAPGTSRKWLTATKAHRQGDVERIWQWEHMGWVPTPDGPPVFIVGKQVIGPEGEIPPERCRVRPGVTERTFAGASRFGVAMPPSDEDALDAFRKVIGAYRATWTDRRVASMALAAGMRPVAPLPFRAPIFFHGVARGGKSWTAKAIMAFWQAYAGAWDESLPGNASDTAYAIENAMSRTVVWVTDDLPPQPDRNHSAQMESKVGDALRASFNRAAKRRMTPEGTTREVLPPRAVYITTAENEFTTASVMERALIIHFKQGALSSVEHIEAIRVGLNLPAMLSGAAVLAFARIAADEGWAAVSAYWDDVAKMVTDECERYQKRVSLPGKNVKRHVDIAKDIVLGLAVARRTCEALGDPALGLEFWSLRRDVYDLVAECLASQDTINPGQSLLTALRSVLRSGACHVAFPGSGTPPALNSDGPISFAVNIINQSLGWRLSADGDRWEPRGEAIGFMLQRSGDDDVVLFDYEAAFAVAQRRYPNLIPFGARPLTSWQSAWDLELTSTRWTRGVPGARPGTKGALTVRVSVDGVQVSGVPVPLSVIIPTDQPEADLEPEPEG